MSIPKDADYTIKVFKGRLLLIETWHIGEASKDIEVEAIKARMARGEVSHYEITNRKL